MALDLLRDEAIVPVCAEAWRRYRDGERGELLASVIEFTSYQAPQVLQDDWEALLALATEDELQLASQVWQGLPSVIAVQWAQILVEADDDREMARARALLLAAQPERYAVARGYLADWGALDAEVWAHWAGVADGPQPRAPAWGAAAAHPLRPRAASRAAGGRTELAQAHLAPAPDLEWRAGTVRRADGRAAGIVVWQPPCTAAAPAANRRCRAAAGRGG